jgi:hypothetical protein
VRARLTYLLLAALVIPLGLGVRAVRLPADAGGPLGDVLWAVELYLVLRALAPRLPPRRSAAVCLLLATLDEASQAIHTPWLDAIRATTLGHLLLGRGFVWLDLLWYALGTAAAWALDERWGASRSAATASAGAELEQRGGHQQ